VDPKLFLGLLAGGIIALAHFIYVRDIFRIESIKPQRASWFILIFTEGASVANQLSSGAGHAIWAYVVPTITIAIIFLVSIKHGEGGFSTVDALLIVLSFGGLALWWFSNNVTYSVIGSVLAAVFSIIPTLIKVYKDPFSENYASWVLPLVAIIIAIFAVEEYSFNSLIILFTWIVLDGCVILLQVFLRPRKVNLANG